ncbi:ribosomal-protein-serine acetyltransferase [Seinonella peptonophila]|uniref:Ribosomal-protein-serine acetyltransferase n=1 Tax=Seinonella peptonophila TaxID=112248 RepID=A0A1M4WLS1_9BACL|nr:ribosomal-protein-serine acetyltransferase [Seinonella peptonophila]
MLTYRVDDEITLRLLDVHHALTLFRCIQVNRKHLRRWLLWVAETLCVEDCWKFILYTHKKAAKEEEFHFGIWYRGELSGVIGAHSIDWTTKSAEVGYWLSESLQGRGIVTRSVLHMIRFLFEEHDMNRVEIRCALSNLKSQAIPRRLGFQLVGMLREAEKVEGQLENLLIFELLRSEWKSIYQNVVVDTWNP